MKTEYIEELYEDFIEADESFNKRKSKNNKEKLIKSISILQNSLSIKKTRNKRYLYKIKEGTYDKRIANFIIKKI